MIEHGCEIEEHSLDSIEQLLKAMRGTIRAVNEMPRPTSQLAERYRDLRLPVEPPSEQTYAETVRCWAFAFVRKKLIDLDPRKLSRDQRHKKRDALKVIKLMALCRSYSLAQDEVDRRHDDNISGEDLSKLYANPEDIWADWQRLTSNDSVVLNADERNRIFAWLRVTYNARSDAWNMRVREGLELVWGRQARMVSIQLIKPRSLAKLPKIQKDTKHAGASEPTGPLLALPMTSVHTEATPSESLHVVGESTISSGRAENTKPVSIAVQTRISRSLKTADMMLRPPTCLSLELSTTRSVIFENLSPGLRRLWKSHDDYVSALANTSVLTLADAICSGFVKRLAEVNPITDISPALDIARQFAYRYMYYGTSPKAGFKQDSLLMNEAASWQKVSRDRLVEAITLLVQANVVNQEQQQRYAIADPLLISPLAAHLWRSNLLKGGLSAISTKPRFYGAIAILAPVLQDLELVMLFENIWNQHFPAPESAWTQVHILEEQSKLAYSKTTAQVLGWCVASMSPIAQMYARDLIRVVGGLLLFEIRNDLLHPTLTPVGFYESLLLLKAIAVVELTRLLDEMSKLVRTGTVDCSRFNRAQAWLHADQSFVFSKRWLISNGLMQEQNNLGHEIRQRLTQISQRIRQRDEQLKRRSVFAA